MESSHCISVCERFHSFAAETMFTCRESILWVSAITVITFLSDTTCNCLHRIILALAHQYIIHIAYLTCKKLNYADKQSERTEQVWQLTLLLWWLVRLKTNFRITPRSVFEFIFILAYTLHYTTFYWISLEKGGVRMYWMYFEWHVVLFFQDELIYKSKHNTIMLATYGKHFFSIVNWLHSCRQMTQCSGRDIRPPRGCDPGFLRRLKHPQLNMRWSRHQQHISDVDSVVDWMSRWEHERLASASENVQDTEDRDDMKLWSGSFSSDTDRYYDI